MAAAGKCSAEAETDERGPGWAVRRLPEQLYSVTWERKLLTVILGDCKTSVPGDSLMTKRKQTTVI